jgi:hypothetical protein
MVDIISILPTDLIGRLVTFLDLRTLEGILFVLSKRWVELGNNKQITKMIKSIDMCKETSKIDEINNKVLIRISTKYTNITHFECYSCKITYKGLFEIAKNCTKLQQINIKRSILSDAGLNEFKYRLHMTCKIHYYYYQPNYNNVSYL